MKLISKLILIGILLFSGCKKKDDELGKIMDVEELPSMVGFTSNANDAISSVLINKDNKIVFLTGSSGIYVSDGSQKLATKLSDNYYYSMDELSNGNVIAVGYNGLVTIFDLKNNTSKEISLGSETTSVGCMVKVLDNGTIFILTSIYSSKILKSSDNGTSWHAIPAGYEGIISSKGNNLYSVVGATVYKSTDFGETFQQLVKYPTSAYTATLSISPNLELYMAGSDGSAYKITADGLNSIALNTGEDINASGSYFYFHTDGSVYNVGSYNTGVSKSSNGIDFSLFINGETTSMSIKGDVIVFGGKTLFYSNNNGVKWKTIGNGYISPTKLYVDNSDILYAKAGNNVFSFSAGGWNLELMSSLADKNSYTRDGNFIVNQKYYSTDGGKTISKNSSALEGVLLDATLLKDETILGVQGDDYDNYSCYCYLTKSAVIYDKTSKSWNYITQKGENWYNNIVENANGNLFGASSYINPISYQTVNEYYKSTDKGKTWEKVELEYYPYAFNSKNNFVSPNAEYKGLWFSNLENEKIHAYTLSSGEIALMNAAFDSEDYLYILSEDIYTYNKIYKSKKPQLKP